MHCANCGHTLATNDTVCTRCGTDISYQARTHRQFVTLAYVIACVVIMAALMYCALLFTEAHA